MGYEDLLHLYDESSSAAATQEQIPSTSAAAEMEPVSAPGTPLLAVANMKEPQRNQKDQSALGDLGQ